MPRSKNTTTPAKSLTRSEPENAYSLSLVRHGTLKAETLREIKAGRLYRSSLVSIQRGTESFDQLGSFENLKAFCLRAMRRQGDGRVRNRSRGVLLHSPPGYCKSQCAKALGNETGRLTVVDVGALLGRLVGQTPGPDLMDAIWAIYTRHYGLDAKQARPNVCNETEAHIKSCYRLASLLDVPLVQAAQDIVPVAVTAGDKIENLRQWASSRCLSAGRAGVYSRSKDSSGGRVRRVKRAD